MDLLCKMITSIRNNYAHGGRAHPDVWRAAAISPFDNDEHKKDDIAS